MIPPGREPHALTPIIFQALHYKTTRPHVLYSTLSILHGLECKGTDEPDTTHITLQQQTMVQMVVKSTESYKKFYDYLASNYSRLVVHTDGSNGPAVLKELEQAIYMLLLLILSEDDGEHDLPEEGKTGSSGSPASGGLNMLYDTLRVLVQLYKNGLDAGGVAQEQETAGILQHPELQRLLAESSVTALPNTMPAASVPTLPSQDTFQDHHLSDEFLHSLEFGAFGKSKDPNSSSIQDDQFTRRPSGTGNHQAPLPADDVDLDYMLSQHDMDQEVDHKLSLDALANDFGFASPGHNTAGGSIDAAALYDQFFNTSNTATAGHNGGSGTVHASDMDEHVMLQQHLDMLADPKQHDHHHQQQPIKRETHTQSPQQQQGNPELYNQGYDHFFNEF